MQRGIWVGLALLGCAWAAAQETPTLQAVKLTAPPTIDGELGTDEWPTEARRAGFFDRDTGIVSDEEAEFWLAYDDVFIYFAGRVYTDPTQIIDDEYRANTSVRGNDHMELEIDLAGVGLSDDEFRINARGATDIELSGGRAAKIEWIGEFEAAGKKTADGWQFEARIPWQVLTPAAAGQRNARFNVNWYRSNRSNTYTHFYNRGNNTRNPIWSNVNVPIIRSDQGINLLPYAFAGVEDNGDFFSQAGVDFKIALPGRMNVIGTINPDDVNIENEVLSLDFSYFERLAGEARPFFQEGRDYFSTGNLFASQRLEHIDAALKFYGDPDERTRIGAMATMRSGKQTAAVLSGVRRFDDRLVAAAAVVQNLQDGQDYTGARIGASYQLGDTEYGAQIQFTEDEQRGTGTSIAAEVEYGRDGFFFDVSYDDVSPNYFPRIGFQPERNYRRLGFFVGHSRELQGGPFQSTFIGMGGNKSIRYDSGDDYREGLFLDFGVNTRSHIGFGGNASWNEFESDKNRNIGFGVQYPNNDPYRNVFASANWGHFAGFDRRNIEFGGTYRVAPFTQVTLSNEFVSYRGEETQQILRVTHDIGRYQGVSVRLIRRDSDLNWNASYRLSGKKGIETFFIVGNPNSRSFENRFALKVVIPVFLRF